LTLIIAYIISILIGFTLGILGGGGSILTVPLLVYVIGVAPVTATVYSLFIVGITSLIGAYSFFRAGLVNLKLAMVFGLPSLFAVLMTRIYVLPSVPEHLFKIGDTAITKSMGLMILFAFLMIFSSFSMIRGRNLSKVDANEKTKKFTYSTIWLQGLLEGSLTGLVGAGGGFLIIPALVVFSKIPIKNAIATSLTIISVKSLLGFTAEPSSTVIDWTLMLSLAVCSVIGIMLGTRLSKNINSDLLKPSFGYFVLVMGIVVLVKELLL